MINNLQLISWAIVIFKLIALYISLFKILPKQLREAKGKNDAFQIYRELLIFFIIVWNIGVLINLFVVGGYVTGLIPPETVGQLLPYAFLAHSVVTLISAIGGYFLYFIKFEDKE